MSAMRLVPQHCLTGLAEALNLIGQIKFYYSEFPKTMSSIGVSLLALGLGFGAVLAAPLSPSSAPRPGAAATTWASRSPAAAPGLRHTEQMDLDGGVYTSIPKKYEELYPVGGP